MRVANLHGSPPSGSRANPRRGWQGQNGVGHCTGEPLSISGAPEPRQRAALHGPLAGRGVPP
jgi:hypothetical protein